MMRWMPINEPLNSTRRTCTSRLVFSYSAAARPMDLQCRPVLHSPKMFIPRLIKLRELLDHLDLNGATQLLNLHPQDHHQAPPRTAGVDWPRSIHHLIPQIHMINESQLVVPVLSLLHHALQVLDKISK